VRARSDSVFILAGPHLAFTRGFALSGSRFAGHPLPEGEDTHFPYIRSATFVKPHMSAKKTITTRT
jgi:hypothetical protein